MPYLSERPDNWASMKAAERRMWNKANWVSPGQINLEQRRDVMRSTRAREMPADEREFELGLQAMTKQR